MHAHKQFFSKDELERIVIYRHVQLTHRIHARLLLHILKKGKSENENPDSHNTAYGYRQVTFAAGEEYIGENYDRSNKYYSLD